MVALKELVFALVPTAQQLDAFEREARLLGSVSHPQIPRLIDSFREGDGPFLRLYLAQELVDGEPLSSRIGIDEAEARVIARQLLNILRYLHERGIVHRDVKPANVLRRPDGSLALVDFGAARAVEGVTHGATLVGTFGYMPPEQLGGTVDATADLYALGATLVHLLGRKAPADILGPDLELRLDHLNVSPGFRAFLSRLTARKRAARPASAAEALLALDAPPRPTRPVRARFLVPLAAVVALGSIVLPWMAMQKTLNALTARPGPNAEQARRAQLEALERELTEPPKPAPPPPAPRTDHRDISLGRLLSGAKLRELDPELPPCYERAGIELARVRVWPGMKALQLKLVLHSQDASCEWLPLEVTASADGGRALHSSGRMGETPRDGWRDVLYNFDLPDGVNAVRPGEPHPRAGVLAHRPRSAGGTSGRVRARRAHRRSIRKGPDAGRLRQARARYIREALDRTGPRPTEAPGASGVRDAEGHEGALPAGIAPRAAGITAEAHLHCPARFGPQRDVHAAASGRARPASGIDGRAFLPRGQHPPDRSAERDGRAGGPRGRYAVIRACFAW